MLSYKSEQMFVFIGEVLMKEEMTEERKRKLYEAMKRYCKEKNYTAEEIRRFFEMIYNVRVSFN